MYYVHMIDGDGWIMIAKLMTKKKKSNKLFVFQTVW